MKKNIILFLVAVFGLSLQVNAQEKDIRLTVSGIVTDKAGNPFPGTTIYVKDKASTGVAANEEGRFTIKVNRGDKLVFSMVGCESYEYLVMENKNDLAIVLQEGKQLEDVVVVGMGQKQRRISSLAAVSTIDAAELQRPTTSVANLLGGRVAGIISMQSSGEPGKNIAEFWVRGIGTFGYSSGALVLIDGLEGNINAIDPADIESFSVLKDASATAVYGVRGANGVVLVTTKRGEAQKMKISARANFVVSQLRRTPEYLGAYDYANLVNEALAVRGETLRYNDREMLIIKDHLDPDMYPDVNWQDEVLNKLSLKKTYYVSGRGGGETARYFMSLGGSNEDAAYKVDKDSPYSQNVGYNTYTYRMNLDLNLSPTTVAYFGSDGFLSIHNQPGVANTDYIWKAQSQLNPLLFPTTYSTGQYPGLGGDDQSSPYVMINRRGRKTNQQYQGKVTVALNQDLKFITEGLKIRAQGAYDIYSYFDESRLIQPAMYQALGRNSYGDLILAQTVNSSPASYSNGKEQYRKYFFESTLNYERAFSDHRMSGLVYYYISDEKHSKDKGNLESIPYRYQGVSSRLTYGYKDTYLIDVNFGYTGSENFQPGHQYGFFPSIALGWIPSQYKFFRDNLPFIDFLKIRASYGSVGNDRIGGAKRFPYLTRMNFGSGSPWASSSVETISENVVGADNLRWEKALKQDLGIDMRLFKEKVNLTVDIFTDKRDGIFQQRVQVPDIVGAVNMPYGNVGKMRSFGADGNASYTQKLNKDFAVTVRGNFTYANTEILNWEELSHNYPYLAMTGYPNSIIRGYKSLGLFADKEEIQYSPKQFGEVQPGDIKYMDVNGDGKISDEDMVPLSYGSAPRLMYGAGVEFQYKNLTLGVLFKGTGKTDYYSVGYQIEYDPVVYNGMGYVPFHNGNLGNVLSMVNDPANRWIPKDYAVAHGIDPSLAENPNARFPKLQYGYNENNSKLRLLEGRCPLPAPAGNYAQLQHEKRFPAQIIHFITRHPVCREQPCSMGQGKNFRP